MTITSPESQQFDYRSPAGYETDDLIVNTPRGVKALLAPKNRRVPSYLRPGMASIEAAPVDYCLVFRPSEDAVERASVASVSEAASVFRQINDLALLDEGDELGLLRPSSTALNSCMRIMLRLAENGALIRPTEIATDANSDIRITWAANGREVEFIVPSDAPEEPYLYRSFGSEYGITKDVSVESISGLIRRVLLG